jgi:hypothetical protein
MQSPSPVQTEQLFDARPQLKLHMMLISIKTLANCQPARLFDHPTTIDQAT